MRRRRPLLPSDQAERDRFLKHLKQQPPPERPLDFGRQSPRLLSEIVEGMRTQEVDIRVSGERPTIDFGGFDRANGETTEKD